MAEPFFIQQTLTMITSSRCLFCLARRLFTVTLLLTLAGCGHFEMTKGPSSKGVMEFPEFVALIVQPGDSFSSLADEFLHDQSLGWMIAGFNDTQDISPGQELIIPREPFGKGGMSMMGYQTVPVLTYHNFSRNSPDKMTVTAREFDRQMKFLHDNGYHVVSMDEFFGFLNFKRPLPSKSVVITIDDGWRKFYDIGFPILKQYGYPATLFVYTDLISGENHTLSWQQIREMAEQGLDIQCHTKTHRNLDIRNTGESLRDYVDDIKSELSLSAEVIKRETGRDVSYLAYPYGDANNLVVAYAKKMGYLGAFTVDRGANPFFVGNYRLKRTMILGEYDLDKFIRVLDTYKKQAFVAN